MRSDYVSGFLGLFIFAVESDYVSWFVYICWGFNLLYWVQLGLGSEVQSKGGVGIEFKVLCFCLLENKWNLLFLNQFAIVQLGLGSEAHSKGSVFGIEFKFYVFVDLNIGETHFF